MVDARDLMITNLITVRQDASVDDAIEILVGKKISGMPVIDANGGLVGLLTQKDLLRLLTDHVSGEVGNVKVSDLMTRDVVSFSPDDSLISICDTLVNKNFRRLPLVEDGKLVGLIGRGDLIRYIQTLRKRGG